jgi:hypothetical protein
MRKAKQAANHAQQTAALLAVVVTESESDEIRRDSLSYLLECVLANSADAHSDESDRVFRLKATARSDPK